MWTYSVIKEEQYGLELWRAVIFFDGQVQFESTSFSLNGVVTWISKKKQSIKQGK